MAELIVGNVGKSYPLRGGVGEILKPKARIDFVEQRMLAEPGDYHVKWMRTVASIYPRFMLSTLRAFLALERRMISRPLRASGGVAQ